MTNLSDSEPISRLIFGTASLTSHRSLSAALQMLDAAFDAGIRHFDTAAVYGKGYSEIITGRFARKRRGEVILSTKFGLGIPPESRTPPFIALPLNYLKKKLRPMLSSGTPAPQVPYADRVIDVSAVEAQLRGSLQRLKTDYLDYFLLHEGIPSFLTDEALQFLLDRKKAGVLLHLGVAANRLNTERMLSKCLSGWDVVQYDPPVSGALPQGSSPLPIQHFFHSILQYAAHVPESVPPAARAGWLLAQFAEKSKGGKVIFTTRHLQRLTANLQYYLHYSSASDYAFL